MQNFESITQYNKKFDDLFVNPNQKGFACGFFSILTANHFLKNNLMDLKTHENNIEEAIRYTAKKKIFSGVNFDDLLDMTSNLNKNNIMATSVELINSGILSFQHIFNNSDNAEKYCIIFLKNEKYFVVMFDKTKNEYYLRDCHESSQYTFNSITDLIIKLSNGYQFTTDIGLIGDEYIAYSSIEFIKITEIFEQKIKENKENKENKNKYDLEEEIKQKEILKKKIENDILEEKKKNELTINFCDVLEEVKEKKFVCEEEGFFIL
jgi:hypothetical protein